MEELVGVKEKWLYFLRHAPDLQVIPERMGEVSEISAAFQIANVANLSAEELEVQERKIMFIHDQRNAILKAEKVSAARGEARGRATMAKEVAGRLLGQMTDQQIAELTGLSLAEIAALRLES